MERGSNVFGDFRCPKTPKRVLPRPGSPFPLKVPTEDPPARQYPFGFRAVFRYQLVATEESTDVQELSVLFHLPVWDPKLGLVAVPHVPVVVGSFMCRVIGYNALSEPGRFHNNRTS